MYSVLHFCSHLSNSVGGVPSTLEVFRHDLLSSYKSNHIIHIKRSDLHVRWEAGWHERLDVHVLPAQSESGGELSSTDFKISKISPYKIKCKIDLRWNSWLPACVDTAPSWRRLWRASKLAGRSTGPAGSPLLPAAPGWGCGYWGCARTRRSTLVAGGRNIIARLNSLPRSSATMNRTLGGLFSAAPAETARERQIRNFILLSSRHLSSN